jgi:flagellar biosynthesis protein FliR
MGVLDPRRKPGRVLEGFKTIAKMIRMNQGLSFAMSPAIGSYETILISAAILNLIAVTGIANSKVTSRY